MKNKIIFFCIIFFPFTSDCQLSFPGVTRCTDSLLLSIKGKYKFESADFGSPSVSAAHKTEMQNRMTRIHNMLLAAIPQLQGLEAYWKYTGGNYMFAPDTNHVNGINTYMFRYTAGFFSYYCQNNDPKKVYPSGETGTWLTIATNGMDASWSNQNSDRMTVDGRFVYQRATPIENWKGYELLRSIGLNAVRTLMICRPGGKPYLPVTRKQYLDYCLRILKKMLAQQNVLIEDPVRRENFRKGMNKWITKYEEEIKKTTAANLQSEPAVIYEWIATVDRPVFTSEADGGGMLVTENPAYFRKDLPKWVPQIFWVRWSWDDDAATLNFKKMFEENFPIDKLQAMIDK